MSTAMPTFSSPWYVIVLPSSTPLIFGYALRLSIAASTKNGRNVRLTPSRAENSPLALARRRAILVTSTSTTVVSCACECRDSTMREAMTLRRRLSFSVVPRSGETVAAADFGAGAGAAAAGAAAAAFLGLLRLGGRLEDVLLADAPTDASTREGRDVDALLGRELADERGEVGAGRLGRGSGNGCRRGRNRSRGCRDGCRGRRLLLGGGLRRALRLGRRLSGGRGGDGLGGRRLSRGRRRGGGTAGTRADHGQHGAHLDRLVLRDDDLEKRAGHRRRNLGVDLVGGDLEQGLVDLDRVADLLEPAGHGALGDGLPESRQRDVLARATAAVRRAGGRRSGLLVLLGRLLRRGLGGGLLGGSLLGGLGRLLGGCRVPSAGADEPSSEPDPESDDEPEPEPMTASVAPTSTVSSSWTRISSITPPTGDGISVSTLSVEISSSPSSASTVSPTFFSQRVTVPSVTDSPRAGSCTLSDMTARVSFESCGQLWACRGLPARARWASPRASFCVGCACTSDATSSG